MDDNKNKTTIKLYPADPTKFKSNPPKYTGPATLNGDSNYRAAAWMQEDKKGTQHLSVSVSKNEDKKPEATSYNSNADLEDEVPF
jgi:hypothetical protein|tara:strand:+ start:1611 stop:1865 length:255 start_codon:yes stop_codon:yes gene_type:complete